MYIPICVFYKDIFRGFIFLKKKKVFQGRWALKKIVKRRTKFLWSSAKRESPWVILGQYGAWSMYIPYFIVVTCTDGGSSQVPITTFYIIHDRPHPVRHTYDIFVYWIVILFLVKIKHISHILFFNTIICDISIYYLLYWS